MYTDTSTPSYILRVRDNCTISMLRLLCTLVFTTVKFNFLHVQIMQAYTWRRGIAPVILNITTRCCFTSR